jgi:hypothetical protein
VFDAERFSDASADIQLEQVLPASLQDCNCLCEIQKAGVSADHL